MAASRTAHAHTKRRGSDTPRRSVGFVLLLVASVVATIGATGVWFRSRTTVDEIVAMRQGVELVHLERVVGLAAGVADAEAFWFMYSGADERAYEASLEAFRVEVARTLSALEAMDPVEAWQPTVVRLSKEAQSTLEFLDRPQAVDSVRPMLVDFPKRFSNIKPSDPRGRWSAALTVMIDAQYPIYTALQYPTMALSRHSVRSGFDPFDPDLASVVNASVGRLDQLGRSNPDGFSPFADELNTERAMAVDPTLGQIVSSLRADPKILRLEEDFHYLVGRNEDPWFSDAAEVTPFAIGLAKTLDAGAELALVRVEAMLAEGSLRATREGQLAAVVGPLALLFAALSLVLTLRARKREESRLRNIAEIDALTGIYNRFALFAQEKERLGDPDECGFALLHLDLDLFKEINDRFGHAAGDAALVAFAEACQQAVRGSGDMLARIGGDEFVVVLHGLSDPRAEAETVAERIRVALEEPKELAGHSIRLRTSVGIGTSMEPTDLDTLLFQADMALLEAKRTRSSRHTVFERNMHTNLVHEVDDALRRGDVQPVFQPIVRATNRRLAGFEVLAHWEREDGSVVPAADFVRVLRSIQGSGAWIDRILTTVGALVAEERIDGRFWINVTTADLLERGDESLVERIRRSGVRHSDVGIEITECICEAELMDVRAALIALRTEGVMVALDDLGSDVVPIRHLFDLPLDYVKLDGHIVHSMQRVEGARRVVEGLFAMAVHLGLKIVAEQIDTGDAEHALVQMGATYLQGNRVGRAMSARELRSYMHQRRQGLSLGGVA